MEKKYRAITKPGNKKSEIYTALGFYVLNNGLHKITGEAEDRYDRMLKITFRAPIFPAGGRGFAYPTDVALEKAIAASIHTSENLIATDACWTDGDCVLNKPGDDPDGIEKAIEWWMQQRGAPIGNLGGTALLDATTEEVEPILIQLDLGMINPRIDISDLGRILHLDEALMFSGGINVFTAVQRGIILADSVAWRRFTYGAFKIRDIPQIPAANMIVKTEPKFIDGGSITFDPANTLAIYSLLYGVEP